MATTGLTQGLRVTRPALSIAEVLSLGAALLHLWVMQEHFEEWWGYGVFFLLAAIAQGLYSLALPYWATRPRFLLLGIGGNLAIVALWAVTRTVGVPYGPHAGDVEQIGAIDLGAVGAEMGIIVALAALLLGKYRLRAVRRDNQ